MAHDSDPEVRGFPLPALDPGWAAALAPHLAAALPPGEALDVLYSGAPAVALLSAHQLPDELPASVRSAVLGRGERRELLLGAPPGGLAALARGSRVRVPGRRRRALLAAHQPGLVPVESGAADARIVPLWIDPSLEPQGEVLERESWLPSAGEGIPVLVAPSDSSIWRAGVPPEDPGAAAVVLGERRIAEAFPGTVCCVRGESFGVGVRFKVVLFTIDGRRAVRGEAQGPLDALAGLVDRVITDLRRRGASTLS